MPIINIGDSKQLEFGYGDIEVGHGLLQSEDIIGTVLFWNGNNKEVGVYTQYEEGYKKPIEETPVRMLFTKTESIDIIISALLEAKIKMQKAELKEALKAKTETALRETVEKETAGIIDNMYGKTKQSKLNI